MRQLKAEAAEAEDEEVGDGEAEEDVWALRSCRLAFSCRWKEGSMGAGCKTQKVCAL